MNLDPSLVVLGMGSLVLGYVAYNACYQSSSTDPSDPDPDTGAKSTNTSNVVPGRHPAPPLRMGTRKLRAAKGAHAWAEARGAFFEP